ncbi:PREDICTED: uncharacterized protein LOC109217047 [Nicotiana attenuata]|uniref:uncharacterized protein LOC109217047 n=1 Tax=Nicotiana attenuata TaxID=49451 RepID=UPI0009057EDE|nr:PREDICTED: uncharacterized protein LOC109217047 [Nicotiana attenuata]
MGVCEQEKIKDHLGNFVNIMEINPRRDLIEALVHFWDPNNNVFRFNGFEMTPTLEELAGYTKLGDELRKKRPLAPRDVTGSKYGCPGGFSKHGKELDNKIGYKAWQSHRRRAFLVAFLGTMVFPSHDKNIDIRLSGMVTSLLHGKDVTIIPMVLSDIYCALTKCQEGKDFFEGCNIILQIWFLEHLLLHPVRVNFSVHWCNNDLEDSSKVLTEDSSFPKGVEAWRGYLQKLTATGITWKYHSFSTKKVIYRSYHHSFLILIGLRGFQPYVPMRDLRQLGRKQVVPTMEHMQRFMWEVTSEDPVREAYSKQVLDEIKVLEFHTMIEDQDQGELDPAYFEWFYDQDAFGSRQETILKSTTEWETEIRTRYTEFKEEKTRLIHEVQALQAQLRQARIEAATQQQAAIPKHEEMHYNLIIHDLRARARAAESSKNQLENELARVQNQLNLASQREADISDIANNHERQIQFLSQSQEHVRRRVYQVATYTARRCVTCQGLTRE